VTLALPRWWPLAFAALAATAGALLAWQVKPLPPPQFRTVIVKDTSLAQQVPHVTPTLGERITKTTVKPTQVAVSLGNPDTALIGKFCVERVAAAMAAVQTSAKPDSGPNQERLAKESNKNPPPILPPFSGRFADNRLELQAVRSDGSLWDATYQATPPLEWVAGHGGASDTAAVVRQNRALFRLLPHLGKCAKGGILGGAIGAGAGLLTGLDVGKTAAIGAGAGCAGSQF
jgi:hypothetical protein